MVWRWKTALALMACLGATGCVSVKHEKCLVPPVGLYTHFRAPLTLPRGPVPCANLKTGTGERSYYVKEWVYSGVSAELCEMTLREAAEKGGLRKIHYADYEQHTFLGFVTLFEVTAYGE